MFIIKRSYPRFIYYYILFRLSLFVSKGLQVYNLQILLLRNLNFILMWQNLLLQRFLLKLVILCQLNHHKFHLMSIPEESNILALLKYLNYYLKVQVLQELIDHKFNFPKYLSQLYLKLYYLANQSRKEMYILWNTLVLQSLN